MNYKKTITVAKGYRLKPETHKMIKQIQKKLKGSQDKIISDALKGFCIKNKININY